MDLSGFLNTGWTIEPESETPAETPIASPVETPTNQIEPPTIDPKDARRDELKALLSEDAGWQSIKEIANKLGIDKKPKGGWDEAIDLILAKEFEAA